ncbi:ABC transporter permease [Eubacterium oxidoreducens]|uniref:NitT/TauT family transport system permease protein n=1 Tax=Eubacterium oxidoreducens TaxID=1732 RepID=A0A1G6A3F7_EUBOX|nr:ABC transporter permease subunit [Eubacterium oxidoreducens]SDB02533.1 NitT/TauT family transport system permease protein [Eubacterium oxidoreducens]
MTLKTRYLRVANLLFLILIAIQFLPDKIEKDSQISYVITFAIVVEAIVLIVSALIKKQEGLNLFLDIIGFLFVFLILWTLATAKLDLLKQSLFPPPGSVFAQFIEDIDKIVINIKSSVGIVIQGYIFAAVIAIILGLFLGWSTRLGNAATYISKFLGSIPPIVYIPYGIALLPTFRSVSVFVIFLATFWPVFAGTMSGVLNVEQKVIDSAKVLNVNKFTMLFSVILPASLPQIFIGCNQGLSVSFILLTSAEMIGAQDGLGYYVKQYSDFGDYTRTIVGLLVIGVVVVVISFLFNRLQRYLLRWKR